MKPPGEVIGRPGGGLANASWAANEDVARIGARGEHRSAGHLNKLAAFPGGPTVLHDLMLPWAGVRANIDHVIVSGRSVWLLDTKVWRSGFYWTLGGNTRRGWERFPYADTQTMELAYKAITGYFQRSGVKATVGRPRVLVWPSSRSSRRMGLGLIQIPGASVHQAGRFFARWGPRAFRTADPLVVQLLRRLVHTTNIGAAAGVTDFEF